MKTAILALLLVAVGFGASWWTASVSNRREAWDAPQFWTVTLPVMIAAAAVAGFVAGGRPLVWGMAVALGLCIQGIFAAGELGSMWPLGLVTGGILGLICAGGAWLGARLRRRVSSTPTRS